MAHFLEITKRSMENFHRQIGIMGKVIEQSVDEGTHTMHMGSNKVRTEFGCLR